MVDTTKVPDKKYFRIGEVSTLVGVDTHVLRYWETEFNIIKPFRGKSKQRLYRRKDVINLLKIRNLLHVQGYTINGARKFFLANKDGNPAQKQNMINPENGILLEVRKGLEDILSILKKN